MARDRIHVRYVRRVFAQSSILVRHMRVHSGETPYHCDFCPMKFSYSHHLLKHVQKVHPGQEANKEGQ
jgi:KRAB domain-containing zinc finger protein